MTTVLNNKLTLHKKSPGFSPVPLSLPDSTARLMSYQIVHIFFCRRCGVKFFFFFNAVSG